MGIGYVDMAFIIGGASPANEAGALPEHAIRPFHLIRVPAIADNDGGQGTAVREHEAHVRHVLGVKTAQVELRKACTAVEHIAHVRHALGVEAAKVEARKATTAVEHVRHVRHVPSVEAAHVDALQRFAAVEHVVHVLYLLGVEICRWHKSSLIQGNPQTCNLYP